MRKTLILNAILTFIFIACLYISCSRDDHGQFGVYMKNGQDSFNNGLYDEAIKTWEKARMISPDDPDINYRMAMAYQQLSQFKSSNQYLDEVIKKNEKSIDAYFMVVQNELFMGNYQTAKSICLKIDKIFPKSYKMIVLKGDIANFMGRYEEGKDFYGKAIVMEPNRSEPYFKMAANLLVQGKAERANYYFRKAIDLGEDTTVQYGIHKAGYQSLSMDSRGAEASMKRALKIQPNSTFVKLKIAHMLFSYGRYEALLKIFNGQENYSNEIPAVQKVIAEALLNTNNLKKANSIIQKHDYRNDPEWLLLLGKYNLLNGSFLSAINCFEQVLIKRKNDPNAYYMLAISYLAEDKINLATQTLVQLLTIFPEMIEAELSLASIYYKKEEYDLSIEYIERVIKRMPKNPRLYIMIGNCRLSDGRYEQAEVDFKKALELDPQSITAKYYLAMTKEKVGKNCEAVELYKAIIEKDHNMADVGTMLSKVLIREEKGEEAIDIFNSIIKKEPKNGYLKLIMGNIYLKLKKREKATYYYRLAVDENPELVEGYKRLSELENDSKQKISILLEAIKKVPNSIELKIALASYYFFDAKLDLALDIIEEIYRIDPNNNAVINNLAWIYLEKDIKLNKAYELAKVAFEKEPENPFYANTLGWALHKKGIIKQAEWHLREAVRLIEKDAEKYPRYILYKAIFSYYLSLNLLENKQRDESMRYLLDAVDLGLPPKYQANAQKILENVKNYGHR